MKKTNRWTTTGPVVGGPLLLLLASCQPNQRYHGKPIDKQNTVTLHKHNYNNIVQDSNSEVFIFILTLKRSFESVFFSWQHKIPQRIETYVVVCASLRLAYVSRNLCAFSTFSSLRLESQAVPSATGGFSGKLWNS